jgi:hypothetical protein
LGASSKIVELMDYQAKINSEGGIIPDLSEGI